MTVVEARKFLEQARDQVRAGAVRRHPRRRRRRSAVPVAHFEDILTDGAGFAGLRDLGPRHGAARSRLHGASAISRRSRSCPGSRAMRASSATATSRASRGRTARALRCSAQLEQLDAHGLDDVHRHRAGVHAARRAAATARSRRSTRPTRSTSPATTTRACRAAASSSSKLVDCAAARSGIDVYQIDHEDANGQFEMNFTYADA